MAKATKDTNKKSPAIKESGIKSAAIKADSKKAEGAGDPYRTRLLDLRARLRGEMGRMADAALNQSRSETSSLPIHLADLGSDNFEQELTLSLVGSEKAVLDKIEFALDRVADGSYGKCEECGKKIPEPRLEAIPYTTVCVQCAELQEQEGGEEE